MLYCLLAINVNFHRKEMHYTKLNFYCIIATVIYRKFTGCGVGTWSMRWWFVVGVGAICEKFCKMWQGFGACGRGWAHVAGGGRM